MYVYLDTSNLHAPYDDGYWGTLGRAEGYGPIEYQDWSNLNARWDRQVVSGLGANLAPECMIEWRGDSPSVNADHIRVAQMALNSWLAGAGYESIAVDGYWGPETCGALTAYMLAWKAENKIPETDTTDSRLKEHLRQLFGFASSDCTSISIEECVSVVMPTRKSAATTTTKASVTGETNWVLWGAVLGGLAIAGALAAKKYGWV